MILIWTQPARADARQIQRYVGRDSPGAAVRLIERFEAKADLLVDNPKLGPAGRRRGTRELVAHPSYVLIYDVTPTTVRILRVMHTARQWPP